MAGCLLAFVLSACGAGDEGFADAEGQGAALSGADSKQTVRGDLRSPVGPVDSALVPTKPSAMESQFGPAPDFGQRGPLRSIGAGSDE